MNAMLRWSPTRRFHFHDIDELFNRSIGGPASAPDESTHRTAWLPAAEGRIEDGVYVMQISLPGVDPKDVRVSLMGNVLTVKGERKADHDSTGKDYFVREIAYGTFERGFELPEGVDAAQVQAKQANGMLEVRVPSPLAAVPRLIEIKAA
jgi:HSP20 family protein